MENNVFNKPGSDYWTQAFFEHEKVVLLDIWLPRVQG